MLEFRSNWYCRESEEAKADAVLNEVYREIQANYPEMIAEAGLKARLKEAYDYARALGFENPHNIVQFLYCEAFAPGFYKSIWIDRWLHHPGRTQEQRFADLCEVIRFDDPDDKTTPGAWDDVH